MKFTAAALEITPHQCCSECIYTKQEFLDPVSAKAPKKSVRICGVMMVKFPKTKLSNEPTTGRGLEIEEVRLVSDLRIMHSKIDELFQVVTNLKRRHDEAAIHKYADQMVLTEDIERVDSIYMWFLMLKEEANRYASKK